jgi:5'-3' exonuclease
LVGDPSDNISGIRGFGLKTILKAFPMMGQDRKLDKEDLYSHALENKKKMKVYDNFLESKSDFERNIELMQLSDTYLPTYAQLHINECLDKKPNKLNRYGFTNLVREDKMSAALPLHISWVNEVFGNMDSII